MITVAPRSSFGRMIRLALVGGAVGIGLAMPMAASAQTLYTGTPVPDAGAADTSLPAGPNPPPVTSSLHTQSSGGLAFTGIDVAELGLLGVAAIATGTVLVRRGQAR